MPASVVLSSLHHHHRLFRSYSSLDQATILHFSLRGHGVNIMRLRQNGCHFVNNFFKCIFFSENCHVLFLFLFYFFFKFYWNLFPMAQFTICQHRFKHGLVPIKAQFGCLHLGQWQMTYLMTLSDRTMSCQPWPPRARYGQWARYK